MKPQKLISAIFENRIPCYFISPHLDDAILSSGDLLYYLSQKTRVTAITVFTSASPEPYTLSAKAYLRQCGYEDDMAGKLFMERRREDIQAFKSLGIFPRHLGFPDAVWRKKSGISAVRKFLGRFIPEFLHVYPVYRLHAVSAEISKEDEEMIAEIGKQLNSIIKEKDNCIVFCPVGFGDKADHLIVRDLCRENFPRVVFWSDFPHDARKCHSAEKFIKENELKLFSFKHSWQVKENLILKYRTQVRAMFPLGSIPPTYEVYFMKKDI